MRAFNIPPYIAHWLSLTFAVTINVVDFTQYISKLILNHSKHILEWNFHLFITGVFNSLELRETNWEWLQIRINLMQNNFTMVSLIIYWRNAIDFLMRLITSSFYIKFLSVVIHDSREESSRIRSVYLPRIWRGYLTTNFKYAFDKICYSLREIDRYQINFDSNVTGAQECIRQHRNNS